MLYLAIFCQGTRSNVWIGQLQKMGILKDSKTQETPGHSKRKSIHEDLANLGPIKPGGAAGFLNFRDNEPRARKGKKSDDDMDSDDDDMENPILGRADDEEGKDKNDDQWGGGRSKTEAHGSAPQRIIPRRNTKLGSSKELWVYFFPSKLSYGEAVKVSGFPSSRSRSTAAAGVQEEMGFNRSMENSRIMRSQIQERDGQ